MRSRWGVRSILLSSAMLLPAAAFGQAIDPHTTPPPVPTSSAADATTPGDPQGDQAIIPEQQFEQQLPSLSGDINAPLEPMPSDSAAAQTTGTQQGATPAATAAATAPITQPIDPGTIAAAPAQDPQLDQPLTPLASFDTAPLQTATDVANAQKTPSIHYDVVVKGLDEVGLEGQFKSLSALDDGKGKAENATMVQERAHQDEALAVRLLKSKGYYDGSAISTIETVPNSPGNVRAIVSATPGKLYTLGTIAIDAQPTVPPELIRNSLPLHTGDPIEAVRVQGAEANVSLTLPQNGYPFAKVGTRDILLDGTTFTGDYTLPVDTGPRSTFGDFELTGDKPVFKKDHIALLARFKQGDLYDVRKTDDLRNALVATGLYSNVAVAPVETDRDGPNDTKQADIKVTQIAGPSRTLAATGGYSTGEGFKLEGSWTLRNLFPPEGALILTGTGGSQEQGASATFRRSNAGKRDRTFSIIASADHSNYDAFDAFTGTIGVNWAYDSTPIWQKTFTYAYGAQLIGTNESVYSFDAGERVRRTYGVVAIPLQAGFDQSDSLLNPTKGYRVKLNLSPETSVQGSVSPYARTMAEADGYFPVSSSIVLAGRVRVGSILGISRDDLAPSRRYYGGGGGSVRGYGYQRLGPLDPNGDPVGGRSINEFSVEARYRFGNFGVVPFVDAGNAYASSMPKFSDLRFGAGIGGRFYTNFGPLRIDIATPLQPRKGDGRIALYISIGQAF